METMVGLLMIIMATDNPQALVFSWAVYIIGRRIRLRDLQGASVLG